MLPKKSLSADLEHRRIMFYEAGLCLSLALAIIAFEWNFKNETVAINMGVGRLVEDIIEVIPTAQNEPQPAMAPVAITSDILRIIPNTVPLDNTITLLGGEDEAALQVGIASYFTPKQEAIDDTNEPFITVEHMPTFMDGGIDAFHRYVLKNLVYSEAAIANNLFGTVYVEFVVNKDGSVGDIKVLRGVDPALDNEVIRVLKKSPQWTPGYQRNMPVRVKYTLPVTFKLSGS